jgi:hypothetical protein
MGTRENFDKKRKTPSIGKAKFVKYLRRHSPLKAKNYLPTNSNDTYVTEKGEPGPESQGFLSIIKINTRSHIESTPQLDLRNADSKRSQRYLDERKENLRDEVIEDLGKESREGQRESLGESYVKVGKLINEKEMAL